MKRTKLSTCVRKDRKHNPLKTEWDTVKEFKIEMGKGSGLWIIGKALNGKRLVKHITTVTLKQMLVDEYVY